MTPKGVARRALPRSGRGATLDRAPLKETKGPAETPPAQSASSALAKRVAQVAAAQPGVAGARLWRLANGRATVWHQTGKLPRAEEIAAERAFANLPAAHSERTQWVSSPDERGQVLTVLEVRGAKPLGEKSRSLLEAFGRIAAAALATAEQQQAVLELSAIVEATKLLNSTLDLGELINIILQLATRLIGADRGTVFLVDRTRNEIWSLLGMGLEQQEIRLPIERGIAGWVACHGETIRLEDAYQDPRFEPASDRRLGYRTRALLCLPIRNKNREIIGVLELLNKATGAFSAADERCLSHLSDHVALGLENARLHREQLAKQRMERDLELARSVQQGLLPERPPVLEGFEISVAHVPSQMVSGDYYDFVRLDPGTLLGVIADVEGKGVASALVMANLQAMLRALTTRVHALEQIASSVNDMILSGTRSGKLLTMFLGLLDYRNRALHYINAGHLPPAVIRAEGETEYLDAGGVPIGAFPHSRYERGFIRLRAGDVLVGYTDGITEANDVRGNEFGIERVVDTVRHVRAAPADQIVQTVFSEVERFSFGGTHEDDRIVLVLKVL
jgi:phosphoserine phosphatase RsbU/P